MSASSSTTTAYSATFAGDRLRLKMLHQMAEALDDEAAGLDRKAASLEEEECLLKQKADEHQTEVNRLLLLLQSIRSEHHGVREKIEKLTQESRELKEQSFLGEDDLALDFLELPAAALSGGPDSSQVVRHDTEASAGSSYFRRMSVTDLID
jgi:hypothetical protein